jgi:hypothetical protein
MVGFLQENFKTNFDFGGIILELPETVTVTAYQSFEVQVLYMCGLVW